MDSYGLNLQGKFVIERVSVRPDFNDDQIGRFIFVENNEQYWLGGMSGWLRIGLADNSITSRHVDWGYEYGQINADTIPYSEATYRYIDAVTVEEALIKLAMGSGLAEKSITNRVLGDGVVKNYNISWGTTGDNVGAKDISIDSIYRETFAVQNIQDAITRLEENCPIILRKIIQTTAWNIVPADGLYHISLVITPINTPYVIVQCYDMTGKQVIPARITTDLSTHRLHIYMPIPINLNVVIVG